LKLNNLLKLHGFGTFAAKHPLVHDLSKSMVEEKMNYFETLKEVKTLLVDDDEFIRDSLKIAFSSKGCSLQATESAEEGLEALEKEKFDIILSDLRLPGQGGLEFLKAVRDAQPTTLCILITAYRDLHVASEVSAMGIHGFIEKPFSIGLLVQSIAKLVRAKRKN
jgi:two-component system response regulator HydG